MSDFLDTPVGSMNFDPARPRPTPKDDPTGSATPSGKPGGPAASPSTTPPPSSASSYDLNGQPLWGTAGGMVYQYGRDSTGRDTFGPGTDEAGNPLGNQDGSMIGSQDPRYGAAQQALAQHPGYTQVRVNQQGVPGGYLDPSQLVYDPVVGLITPIGNINQGHDDTLARMLGVVIGGPLLGAAGNALFGAGEVVGPVAGGGADVTPGAAAAVPGGDVGPPAGLAPDPVTGLPPGADVGPPASLAPDPVTGLPPGADVGPPAGLAPDPVTGLPTAAPPPATVADGLTPQINDLVTPPPVGGGDFTPSPGGGLDYSPTLPGTPDFNVPMQPPPDVPVPPPDIPGSDWWQAPLASITDHPLQAAGLGITAVNALNRPKPPTIPNTVPDTNKPVIDSAVHDILNKGALSGDQQHSIDGIIDRHIREGVEAINQRAINSGMGANSMVTQQQINQFKQNAETVREQMYQQQMQQNIGNAISVWAEGNREDIAIQTAAANLAMENNREVAAMNQSIAQSLGWLYSMSNSRTTPSALPGG